MPNLFDDDNLPLDEIFEDAQEKAELAEPITYTPRDNPDLVGHAETEQRLLDDFSAGKMPHAIILAGASGIGKATLAYRLARFLLSAPSLSISPLPLGESWGEGPVQEREKRLYIPPTHPVFRRVASGGHADLLTVEREWDEKKDRLKNDISVDSVRRITPFLRKTAAEGGWRVVIVDGAECLNTSSQNALLKILEEPPAKALLILTTTQPGLFLPTIRSRCRMLRMNSLTRESVAALLDQRVPGLSGDEKSTLCRLSAGSIGKAMHYHAEGGLTVYRDLLKAAETLPALDLVMLHEMAEKIGKSEAHFDAARDIMTDWCAQAAQAQARGQSVEILQKISTPRRFLDAWEKISQLFHHVDTYNLDKRQAIIGAFLMLQNPNYQGLQA